MLNDDGDVVRGLGFVALHAAYLEEQIDNLLIKLIHVDPYDEKKQRWPISKKIRHAVNLIKKLDTSEFPDFEADLQTCIELFEDRNKLIHGRIYANFDRPSDGFVGYQAIASGNIGFPARPLGDTRRRLQPCLAPWGQPQHALLNREGRTPVAWGSLRSVVPQSVGRVAT